MLAAVSIYNNPLITFKTETCISLICNAWTYLLQAHCESEGMETRQPDTSTKRKRYKRNEDGEYLLLSLKELVSLSSGLLGEAARENLQFLIGIRNRIQHSADNSIDVLIAPNLQANVMNFRNALQEFTNGQIDIANSLSLSLQFSELSLTQTNNLLTSTCSSPQLRTFIISFESELSEAILRDTAYSAKVRFELENKSRGKDAYVVGVYGFGEEIPEGAQLIANKEVEKPKYRPGEIVRMMNEEGWTSFSMILHTTLWKEKHPNARNKNAGYGTTVSGTWFWYRKWIDEIVRPFCEAELVKAD